MRNPSQASLGLEYRPLPDLSSLRHLLIILFGGIGDLVCLTAALSVIRNRFPGLEIYLLSDAFARDFFPRDLLTRLFTDESDFLGFARSLDKGKAIAVNLHSTNRSAKLLAELERIGLPVFGLLERDNRLLVRGTVFNDLLDRVFYVRFQDTYIANWIMPGRSAMFSLCFGLSEVSGPRIEVVSPKGDVHGDYVVFVPDANAPTRRWPLDYWRELARMVHADYGWIPVILARDRIEGFSESTVNLSGQTSLKEAIGYLPGAKLVVSNDTGMIHLAAALGRPTLVVCGPNNVGPEAEGKFLSIRYPVDCSPCFRSHCESMACMKELRPELVKSAFDWLMGRGTLHPKLVAGYSWEQPMSLFYDLHSTKDIPYQDGQQVFANLVRWAWLYGIMIEEGIDGRGFAGFKDYFHRFHSFDVNDLTPMVSAVISRLNQVKGLLLPLREKIGILIKKGGALTSEVASSLESVFSGLERELVYPWYYLEKRRLEDYLFVVGRILTRIDAMEGFLRNYVKERS